MMGFVGHQHIAHGAILTTIVVTTLLLCSTGGAEQASPNDHLAQARAAYRKRRSTAQSVKAVELYEKAITTKATYEACWEGARAASHLGQNGWSKAPRQKRQDLFQKGLDWAKQATKINPGGAEGHYYTAVLTGLNAQERTFFHQMASAKSIRLAAERAAKINPRVECGGPVRLLGLYYRQLPTAFGGNNHTALSYLEKAARFCPDDREIRYELAECLHTVGQDARARKEAQWVIDNPPTTPNDLDDYRSVKRDTEKLLQEIDGG